MKKIITIVFFGLMVVSSARADLSDLNDAFENISLRVLDSVCQQVGSGNYIKASKIAIVCEGVSDTGCKDVATVSEKYGMTIKTEYIDGVCKMSFDKKQGDNNN